MRKKILSSAIITLTIIPAIAGLIGCTQVGPDVKWPEVIPQAAPSAPASAVKPQAAAAALIEPNDKEPNNAASDAELHAAAERFYAALNAMLGGNSEPLKEVWCHKADVTNMGPLGGLLVGWESIIADIDRQAALKSGGRITAKDVLIRTSGGMGYVMGVEQNQNVMAGGRLTSFCHRATNVFRREGGVWKLVHRHTNPAPELQEAMTESPTEQPKESRILLEKVPPDANQTPNSPKATQP